MTNKLLTMPVAKAIQFIVAICGGGNQTSVLTASVGITVVVLVLILCLSGFICFRKKASKFTASDGQEGDYVNVNISNKTIAPTAQQRAKTTDNEEEESVYANVSNMAMTPSAKDRRHQK